MQAPLKEHLPKFYMVADISTTVAKEDVELIAPTGLTDRPSLGHTTGNTDAVISATRRRGRQRSKGHIPSEHG